MSENTNQAAAASADVSSIELLPAATNAAFEGTVQTQSAPASATRARRGNRKPAAAVERAMVPVGSKPARRRQSGHRAEGWMALARRAWQWLQQRQWQSQSRRLCLCETVSLGDKRFLAIVKVDGEQFLVGGAAGSVALLTRLAGTDNFSKVLQKQRRGGRAIA